MDIHPYTDSEWDTLLHVFLTGETDWDPSILDHDHADDDQWADALSDLEADPKLICLMSLATTTCGSPFNMLHTLHIKLVGMPFSLSLISVSLMPHPMSHLIPFYTMHMNTLLTSLQWTLMMRMMLTHHHYWHHI